MANCIWRDFGSGVICERCGERRRRRSLRTCPADPAIKLRPIPKRKPTQPDACPHFLGGCYPPESTLLFGCGCASSKANGIEVTVSGCELHGRCVTFAKGTHLADATIQRCVVCPDRPR